MQISIVIVVITTFSDFTVTKQLLVKKIITPRGVIGPLRVNFDSKSGRSKLHTHFRKIQGNRRLKSN